MLSCRAGLWCYEWHKQLNVVLRILASSSAFLNSLSVIKFQGNFLLEDFLPPKISRHPHIYRVFWHAQHFKQMNRTEKHTHICLYLRDHEVKSELSPAMLGVATHTELTVAQDGLGGEYQAVRSAGWICSLQMGCRCPQGGCSSPTTMLLLLHALHESLLTAQFLLEALCFWRLWRYSMRCEGRNTCEIG